MEVPAEGWEPAAVKATAHNKGLPEPCRMHSMLGQCTCSLHVPILFLLLLSRHEAQTALYSFPGKPNRGNSYWEHTLSSTASCTTDQLLQCTPPAPYVKEK